MDEKHTRSASKSIIWRIVGIVVLAIITYVYTRSWIQTTLVTVIHHGAFLFIYYAHERIWLKITWPKTLIYRSVARMLTYETVLGNIILGIITYTITGDWKTMTEITITYIGIKHVIYICNEFVWNRIKWGVYREC